MARKIDLSPRKQAKQERAVATVDAIVEAAAYILKQHGPAGFTANKVAERAGVNIASFYQYFPNKQALLSHITKITWEKQLARLAPILTRSGDRESRFREFVREFFFIEAAEADMRRALKLASVDLKETDEFQALLAKGAALTRDFLKDIVVPKDAAELSFISQFLVTLVTSFAERTTDEGTSRDVLLRQADLLSELVSARFQPAARPA